MRMTADTAILLFAAAALLPAAAGAPFGIGSSAPGGAGPAVAAPDNREEALWQRIRLLTQVPTSAEPFVDWFQAVAQRRTTLLDRVRLYITLYPGGAHRDEAIRLELNTLFELAALHGGDLTALRSQAAAYLANPPSPAAAQEAAYWKSVCERTQSAATRPVEPAAGPRAAGAAPLTAEARAASQEHFSRHPESWYAPRWATRLFEDAAARGDQRAMRAVVDQLVRAWPRSQETRDLSAQWNRACAVGQPFHLAFRAVDGTAIDTRSYVGHPVVIVVWAGFDDDARRRVCQVEEFHAAHSDLRVVGVNIDADARAAAEAARAMGVDWPQLNDGFGWGGEFLRTWGLRYVPWVFVVDRAGNLSGATPADEWRAWAEDALATPTAPPPTPSN